MKEYAQKIIDYLRIEINTKPGDSLSDLDEIAKIIQEAVHAAQQSVQADGATPWACQCDWVNDANNIQCVACGTPRR